MRNVKLMLQYDGTEYAGFAVQPNAVTIAEKLLAAIRATTGETVQAIAAGRTDAGVHARGQVVNFYSNSRIPVERMVHALNARLPADIRVMTAEDTSSDFHARFRARGKTYLYSIDNSMVASPLCSRYALHERRPLDLQAMQQAGALLVGRHDFAAFRSAGGAARTSIRHLTNLAIWTDPHAPVSPVNDLPGRLVRILVEADGFLYNMVRIIVGTLLEVGAGKRELAALEAAIHTGRRELAGRTAPAHGLCLEHVRY